VKPKPGIQTPWCCPSLGIRFPDVAQTQELYWQVLPHPRNPTSWCCSTSGILLPVVATPRNQTSRYCSTLGCCPTLGVKLLCVAQPSKSTPRCCPPPSRGVFSDFSTCCAPSPGGDSQTMVKNLTLFRNHYDAFSSGYIVEFEYLGEFEATIKKGSDY
jgi:hypothetical protein